MPLEHSIGYPITGLSQSSLVAAGCVTPPEHSAFIKPLLLLPVMCAAVAQVSYEFASILQDYNFTCNSMGGETRLDLATYNFTGKRLTQQ